MSQKDKMRTLKEYGIGLFCLVIAYSMLATLRDFRDNFSVEIWNEIAVHWDATVFSQTEMISGVIVLVAVGAISVFKNNIRAFWATIALIAFGVLSSGLSTLLFEWGLLSPFLWMLFLGTGLFLAYIPMQIALFERMIAAFRIKSNAGFFVYICDAIGYLGSVILLLYKEFFSKALDWSAVMIKFSHLTTFISVGLILIAIIFFHRKLKPQVDDAPSVKPVESFN